jgi:hypothetical protein
MYKAGAVADSIWQISNASKSTCMCIGAKYQAVPTSHGQDKRVGWVQGGWNKIGPSTSLHRLIYMGGLVSDRMLYIIHVHKAPEGYKVVQYMVVC